MSILTRFRGIPLSRWWMLLVLVGGYTLNGCFYDDDEHRHHRGWYDNDHRWHDRDDWDRR